MLFTDSLVLLSPNLVIYVVASSLLFTISCRAIYQITIHPLARYPGPLLAKFTNLYATYHAWRGDLHVDMWRCHERYGDKVRYGPNRLLFNSSKAMHDIYGAANSEFCKKGAAYSPMVPEPEAWTTMTAVDETIVRQKRKLVSKMVCDDSLRSFEPRTNQYIDTFCKVLEEDTTESSWSDAKNLTIECRKLMTAIMSEYGFGERIDVFTNPDLSFVLDALENYAWRMGIYKESPFLRHLHVEKVYEIICGSSTAKKWQQWGETYMSTILSFCRDIETGTFSAFVNFKTNKTGKSYSPGELSSEAFFLMLAGSDTSATTASGVLFYLAHHPDVYARLAENIRIMYSDLDQIKPNVSRCTYLNACIMETLRLSPATVSAPWRDVQREGASIDGTFIPGGFEIGTCIYAIHHNEAYFPHAHEFIPERWLPDDPVHNSLGAMNQQALTPFGIGNRKCPGRAMAMQNLHLIIARIIWLYDFRLADGDLGLVGQGNASAPEGRHRVKEFQLRATITSMSDGPYLVFRRRAKEAAVGEI